MAVSEIEPVERLYVSCRNWLLANLKSAADMCQRTEGVNAVYILNGNESSCIHKLGSRGNSILPRSQSESRESCGSVVDVGSLCEPEELEVPGSPLEIDCKDGAMTLLASR